MTKILLLDKIHKSFKEFHLKDISFELNKGEILSIIGPSGSGKSTIIKIILGIIKPDKGRIIFNNEDIIKLPPEMRNFGYIPQSIGLFAHLTVKENIEFPLKMRKIKKGEREKTIDKIIKDFDINRFSERYPKNLSGGEMQKVALARAFVFNPFIVLMDEPMNSIDYQKREKYINFIKDISKKYDISIIYVTHNFEEAIEISDKIIALKEGKIIKKGDVDEFIKNPEDSWIASFLRHKNIISGYLENRLFKVKDSSLLLKTSLVGEGECFIMIRGDEIIVSKEKIESSALNCFKGKIVDFIHNPYNKELVVDVKGIVFKVLITDESFKKLSLHKGSYIYLSFKANSVKKL